MDIDFTCSKIDAEPEEKDGIYTGEMIVSAGNVDTSELIENIGTQEIIDTLGKEEILDTIGKEEVLEHFGVSEY